MTSLKSTRFVRTLAVGLPIGAMLLPMSAVAATQAGRGVDHSLVASGLTQSSGLGSLDFSPQNATTGEHIKLAGKFSSAIRGGVIGSRAARGSNKSDDQNDAGNEPEPETEVEKSQSDSETTPSGPFKVMIPGQAEAPAPAQPPVAGQQVDPKSEAAPTGKQANPAATSGPVRTILDRSATDRTSGQPAGDQQAGATRTPSASTIVPAGAQPPMERSTPKDAADGGCIAGCYETTSTQLTPSTGRRAAGTSQTGKITAQVPVVQSGIECLAGCDGIDGRQLPRATSGTAATTSSDAPTSSSQGGSSRITIMRGNTRTKSYGNGQ